MKNIKVIHIDADDSSLNNLKEMITQWSDLSYEGGFHTIAQAIDCLNQERIGLLFLDAALPDGNAISWAAKFINRDIVVVFLSNSAEYAIEAFRIGAFDFLAKPLSKQDFLNWLQRYNAYRLKFPGLLQDGGTEYSLVSHFPGQISIATSGKTIIIKLADILYFSSKENYTTIHVKNNLHYLSSRPIRYFEKLLEGNQNFFRIHRSYIINTQEIFSIVRNGKQYSFSVVMSNSEKLELSTKAKERLLLKFKH